MFLGPVSGANDANDADGLITGQGGVPGMMPNASACPGDIDGDGIGDLILGADEAGSGGSYAGIAYLISGDKALGDTDVQLADAKIEGDTHGEQLGRAVTGLGDQDGDGRADFVVGAWNADGSARASGAAFLFYGPVSGTKSPSDADAAWYGPSANSGTSISLAGGYELTGDSYADIVIGAYGATGDASFSGVVYVVPGMAP